MEQASVVRATLVVALAAILDAVLGPYLTLGYVSPKLTLIAIVFAVSHMRDLQAVLVGFFGGILLDALGSELFGVGAMGGLISATLAARAGSVRRKGTERVLLAQVVGMSVLGYDLIGLAARLLAGIGTPSIGEYAVTGLLPDVALNVVLAYLVGGWLLKTMRPKNRNWEGR